MADEGFFVRGFHGYLMESTATGRTQKNKANVRYAKKDGNLPLFCS
jgi:hypothetical protein